MDSLELWRARAIQARRRADRLENPKLKGAALRLAFKYNVAAARAVERQRMRRQSAPITRSPQPPAEICLLFR
jgi:hypothetical protein